MSVAVLRENFDSERDHILATWEPGRSFPFSLPFPVETINALVQTYLESASVQGIRTITTQEKRGHTRYTIVQDAGGTMPPPPATALTPEAFRRQHKERTGRDLQPLAPADVPPIERSSIVIVAPGQAAIAYGYLDVCSDDLRRALLIAEPTGAAHSLGAFLKLVSAILAVFAAEPVPLVVTVREKAQSAAQRKSQPPQKHGPNYDTGRKIKQLALDRETSLQNGKSPPQWMNACHEIKIKPSQVIQYAPRLRRGWDDPSYHWNDADYQGPQEHLEE